MTPALAKAGISPPSSPSYFMPKAPSCQSQVVVYSPEAGNNTVELLFGTSLYDLKSKMLTGGNLMVKDGLRLFTPEAALLRVPEDFMRRNPLEVQVALASIKDASTILAGLLEGGHTVVAGRLAGAFSRIKREDVANEIINTMKAAGHNVRISDPFAPEQTFGTLQIGGSPIVGRLQGLWASLREPVIAAFPRAPGLPEDTKAYLQFVADSYQSDAYHSLSIEGYRVSPELIERVRSGTWNPDQDSADQKSRDALAARGYWQAFEKVKETVGRIIGGADAGALIPSAQREWYRELFHPSVVAGITKPAALAGYRNVFIYIKGSRYVPPRSEVVPDAMNAYFDLLKGEKEPSVRAVLGHWLFGFIHPYQDGNGRIARLVMNAMLASGGYPWTVIRVEDRVSYLKALDSASIGADIEPFAEFIATRVKTAMDKAAKEASKNGA